MLWIFKFEIKFWSSLRWTVLNRFVCLRHRSWDQYYFKWGWLYYLQAGAKLCYLRFSRLHSVEFWHDDDEQTAPLNPQYSNSRRIPAIWPVWVLDLLQDLQSFAKAADKVSFSGSKSALFFRDGSWLTGHSSLQVAIHLLCPPRGHRRNIRDFHDFLRDVSLPYFKALLCPYRSSEALHSEDYPRWSFQ